MTNPSPQPYIQTKGDILIVDDTLPNLRVLSSMLTEQGYEVRGAPNAQMALMIIEAEPPDLILLDINMPGMNGYELCEAIKAKPGSKDIPVIFISALDEVLDKVKAFSVGGVDYITKPFQIAEVLVRVRTHLTIRTLQQQLQETNADLQQANVDLQKANIELLESNLALQASNQELDAFARTVAHDLKNPFSSIVGVTDRLKDDLAQLESENPATLKLLEQIERGGQQGVKVIDNLLLLAWVRKGEVEVKPVDMASVVSRVQESLADMIQTYQGELIVPSRWPTALGYGPWLEEVWANYISNGLKFGGESPRLELGATPLASGQVRFWVRDSGEGLSLDEQAHLFADFASVDEMQADGQGLGLSIVRRVVEKLGGSVGVESKVGQGSQFYFTLPSR
ncbi:MAG: hybrid sensor histidine kinase/response regulator [Anaerolineae bacterium]|nr:hybrid sensor histidine kinase/response regulator [Anaerolineae bacterium]